MPVPRARAGNPVVFLELAINDDVELAGRIHFELFVHRCPQTCENFRAFCTGTALSLLPHTVLPCVLRDAVASTGLVAIQARREWERERE